MTIHIEVRDNLVDNIGQEIAEMQDLIGTIESQLRMLSKRADAFDELHDDLLHAEAEALEESQAMFDPGEDDQVEENEAGKEAQDTELVRVLGGTHGFFNLVEELMYYIADCVGPNDLDQVSLMKAIHEHLEQFDADNQETDLSLAKLYRAYSFGK